MENCYVMSFKFQCSRRKQFWRWYTQYHWAVHLKVVKMALRKKDKQKMVEKKFQREIIHRKQNRLPGEIQVLAKKLNLPQHRGSRDGPDCHYNCWQSLCSSLEEHSDFWFLWTSLYFPSLSNCEFHNSAAIGKQNTDITPHKIYITVLNFRVLSTAEL